MIKHCKYCGKLFETNHSKKIFCSVKCRSRYYYIADMMKLEEEARKAKEKRKKQEGKIHVQAKIGIFVDSLLRFLIG